MHTTSTRIRRSTLRWTAASLITTTLAVTACGDGGIGRSLAPATPAAPATSVSPTDAGAAGAAARAAATGIAAGGALTNGGNNSGSITLAGQVDTWTFTASTGDYIHIAIGEVSGDPDFTPWIQLVDPSSGIVATNWNAAAAQITANAAQNGTYTVKVATADPGNDAKGNYSLILVKTPGTITTPGGDQGGTMTNGAIHTGTIFLGDLDAWQFTAATGDYIHVAIGEVSGSVDFTPYIRLVSPSGAILGTSWGAAAAQVQSTAAVTGTYTVIVTTADAGNDATGDYRLNIAKAPGAVTTSPGDQGGALTNGATSNGRILVGDLDVWTIAAAQGDYIHVAIGEITGSADFTPWIRIIGPNGAVLGTNWNVAAAQITLNAPLTGTYTIVATTADAGNDDTGDYRLTAYKAPGAITTKPGDQGGAMTNGAIHTGSITVGDVDGWQFAANQGDYIHISVGEVTGSADFTPYIRLVSPSGAILGTSWGVAAAQIAVNAPLTGTYLVVITTADAGNDDTGSYQLTLGRAPGALTVSPGDQGGTLTNGGDDTGAITVGDLDFWTFTGNQGFPMTISLAELSGSADFTPWIRLVAPNGAVVNTDWNTTVAQISAILPQTGTYMVVVGTADPGNDATGNYKLVLEKAGGFSTPPGDEGGAVQIGANTPGQITIGDLDRFTFQANQGDVLAISVGELSGTADFTPWLRLASPTGQILGSTSSPTVSQVHAVATVTGTYTMVIGTADAGNDATGSYVLTVAKGPGSFIVPAGDQGGPMTNNVVHNGTITIGDLDEWSFTANAGSTLSLTITKVSGTADFTPWIRLIAPNAVILGTNWGPTGATINVLATVTGTYAVFATTADTGNDATGDYTLKITGAN
ncbi:MAG: hypothetical protein MNPFHGCM_02698 [Gemmatimonadaceae bacterium]|nr:hypothetical protein [Gemmatimonadaceae bacterium]